MTITATKRKPPKASSRPPTAPSPVPPLESGDRLSRAEFWRRYDAHPEIKVAELVEGSVYVGSPVRWTEHAEPRGCLVGWATTYCASTPGVRCGDNATVRLDNDNVVQPDVLLLVAPELGGRCQESQDGYLEGPPELVVEVAASSASYDLHQKLRVYQRSGIQEYLVAQAYEPAR
jgi:Uma2 family endonuclease